MDNTNRYARYGSITYYGDIDVIIEMFGQPDLIGVVGDEGDIKDNKIEQILNSNTKMPLDLLIIQELDEV